MICPHGVEKLVGDPFSYITAGKAVIIAGYHCTCCDWGFPINRKSRSPKRFDFCPKCRKDTLKKGQNDQS